MSRRRNIRQSRVVPCPYCQGNAELLPSSAPLYHGRDYGPAWACMPCGAWVGCHKGTDRPLGRLANAELRAMKIRAHAAFDPIWKDGLMDRNRAYAWLSDQLGLDGEQTHIGMFGPEECQLVETVSEWWREGRKAA